MRLGLGIGLGSRAAAGSLARFQSAQLRLLVLPDRIVAAGGHGSAIVNVPDATGIHTPGLPTGTTTLHVAGSLRGVRFTGSSHVQGPLVMAADQPCVVFVGMQVMVAEGSARASAFAMSDNGDAERGGQVYRLFGSAAVRQPQNDDGNAQLVTTYDQAGPVLYRAAFTATGRELWVNGRWAGGNVLGSTPARAVNLYRAGRHFDDSQGANIVWFTTAVYEGAMSLADQEDADRDLRAMLGIADTTFTLPAATVTTGDPRFSVVPSTIETIVGQDVTLQHDNVHLRDGVVPGLVITSDLPRRASTPDRHVFRPASAGTYAVTLAEAGYQRACSIVAVPPIAANASELVVELLGDSNGTKARLHWLQILKQRLGARIRFVGTTAAFGAGFTEKCTCVDGTTWPDWATSDTLFGGITNPLRTNGAVDIPTHLGQLAANPGVLVFNLGQNDFYNSTLANIPTTFTASMVHAHTLFDAYRVALPGVKIAVVANYPLAANPAVWTGVVTRAETREKAHLWNELTSAHFAPLAGDGYHVIDTWTPLDCVRGYPDLASPIGSTADPTHHNATPAGVAVADKIEAFLAHHAY